jgi:uncharacterized protein (TIGR03083 family)
MVGGLGAAPLDGELPRGCTHRRRIIELVACQTSTMKAAALLHTSAEDARALLAAAETGWERPVPHCPDWNAADLVRHTGVILLWMAAIVTSRERVSRRTLDPAPEDLADLPPWYLTNLERTLEVLGSSDPESETWTFASSGDRRVGWWTRRLAVEFAIHRWDAEHAVATDGGPPPRSLDGDVAAAGVEEFITEFLPGLVSHETIEGLSGTLHLHATDAPMQWWIDLDTGGTSVHEHAKADTAVRGTRSELLLWLTNRCPLDTLDVFGRREILDRWAQLRR